MNYKKIHDNIIASALRRTPAKNTYTERHHILPRCEGGSDSPDNIVVLTHKEHRLVHYLRYKFTGDVRHLHAYYMRTKNETISRKLASIAAKKSHKMYMKNDPVGYINKQRKAGKLGGLKAKTEKLGFHSMNEEDLIAARKRGTDTIVKNKLGMFSDEYRERHKKIISKSVLTPDGIFDNMIEAAKHYNVCNATITYRVNNIKETWNEWRYVYE